MATAKSISTPSDGYGKPFATRLRQLIEETKTSQVDLAKDIGVTRQAVSSYSLGATIPDIEKFEKIADYFSVSLDYMLGRSNCKAPENHDIHAETGLSEDAIKALRYCAALGDNSITRTVNALLEGKDALTAIAHYLYYDMENSAITVDNSALVPFRAKYRYYVEKAEWTNSDSPAPVDIDSVVDCLTNEKYQKMQLLEVEERLAELLGKVKVMDDKNNGDEVKR